MGDARALAALPASARRLSPFWCCPFPEGRRARPQRREAVLEDMLLTVLMTSVLLVYAATGELIVERSGVPNLGVESMMLMGR